MPVKEHQCSQYADLRILLQNLSQEEGEIFVFFSCTLDHHGEPVAKLCFEAEDALMDYTEFLRCRKTKYHLIYFRTDLTNYYKCDSNFAQDDKLRVFDVPTLLKWQGFKRLNGRQCCKIPLLAMLFEDEARSRFTMFEPCSFFLKATDGHEYIQDEECGDDEMENELTEELNEELFSTEQNGRKVSSQLDNPAEHQSKQLLKPVT